MNLVLTIRVRIGDDGLTNEHDVGAALEGVAQRFRGCDYIDAFRDNPGHQITRAVINGEGKEVGEFTLMESRIHRRKKA